MSEQIRQGDILLTPADDADREHCTPKEAEHNKAGGIILAHGEVTGHQHVITSEFPVELLRTKHDGRTFLDVRGGSAVLSHDTHEAIEIPQGLFQVHTQREADPLTRHATPSRRSAVD